MPEVVKVSAVETSERLMTAIEGYFKKGHYSDITRAIGLHSTLIEPGHMIEDQARLYRSVLNLIKDRIAGVLGRQYASWYADFPKILDGLVADGQIITDTRAADVLVSRRAAFGPFKSVDDFYTWALYDRRLPLDQIVKYLEKTAGVQVK